MSDQQVCRHCGEDIERVLYIDGSGRWMHTDEFSNSDGYAHCRTTIAGPVVPCPTCEVGPSRETVGMVCQTCGRDYSGPPDCDGHREQQHRDGKPPWCSRCGWTRGQPAKAAAKIGTSIAERDAVAEHKPWSPR